MRKRCISLTPGANHGRTVNLWRTEFMARCKAPID
jgi:hypothetical protein